MHIVFPLFYPVIYIPGYFLPVFIAADKIFPVFKKFKMRDAASFTQVIRSKPASGSPVIFRCGRPGAAPTKTVWPFNR